MAKRTELDVDSVAEIGLMFLDGDSLEEILLDRYGHTDYDFEKFNACKTCVMKMERLNPSLNLTAILWQFKADNPDMAEPVVAGRALPPSGFRPTYISPELRAALGGQRGLTASSAGEGMSHYYPVKNSDAEVVGVLELLEGKRPHADI